MSDAVDAAALIAMVLAVSMSFLIIGLEMAVGGAVSTTVVVGPTVFAVFAVFALAYFRENGTDSVESRGTTDATEL